MTAHTRSATGAFFVIFSLAFFSCKHQPVNNINIQRGFYYWKSSESVLDAREINCVKILGVTKLYVKYFEVEFSNVFGVRPTSKAPVNFRYADNAEIIQNAEIIPVVFIKNDVLINTTPEDLDSLAGNILFLVSKRYKDQMLYNKSFEELQIDCDWTAATRDKYFLLLKSIKKISGKIISCTLRLYPYKYPDLMGVPPVDKATLMCYNLNNPLENENKNSILDVGELKKYLTSKKTYPLHLDIALPLHSWMLCFQNNRFTGILHNQDVVKEIAEPIKPLWYRITKDTVINDIFLRVGDKIKYENVSKEQLIEVVKLLKTRFNFTGTTTISFFHLDKTALNKYSNETLDDLYNSFK
jgi:hypothetical protein